jgi:hypothetical protein
MVLYRFAAYACVLLGIAHAAATPAFYEGLTVAALWFIGTGLATAFLGLLNLAAARTREPRVLTMCVIANIVSVVYGIGMVFTLREVQAAIALVVFVAVTVGALRARWVK